jgi:hypothetical protein
VATIQKHAWLSIQPRGYTHKKGGLYNLCGGYMHRGVPEIFMYRQVSMHPPGTLECTYTNTGSMEHILCI